MPKNSGRKTKLQYQQPKEKNKYKKKRKRYIIWFNPPYSKSVKTNIGRIFIKLIGKHFPPNHKLVKIFNKNTIKLSSKHQIKNERSQQQNTATEAHRATEIMQPLC